MRVANKAVNNIKAKRDEAKFGLPTVVIMAL